jgi:hypothetical protein
MWKADNAANPFQTSFTHQLSFQSVWKGAKTSSRQHKQIKQVRVGGAAIVLQVNYPNHWQGDHLTSRSTECEMKNHVWSNCWCFASTKTFKASSWNVQWPGASVFVDADILIEPHGRPTSNSQRLQTALQVLPQPRGIAGIVETQAIVVPFRLT